ncbi:hypothetical protein [Halococcus agarilyticus]|uniref:hypothetical protein n=1 Tax=Halococcus agarilyticus TaxID=1232219 RepID=UPI000B03C4FF|nr:hypothetical protein [Halococcus agarilyticus]
MDDGIDVESPEHETCALGDAGYGGWVTIEHEPFDRDPLPEPRTSLDRLREWLGEP